MRFYLEIICKINNLKTILDECQDNSFFFFLFFNVMFNFNYDV